LIMSFPCSLKEYLHLKFWQLTGEKLLGLAIKH